MSSFTAGVRGSLLSEPEVTRLHSLRRGTSLFAQGQSADSIYWIDDGLVKLTRSNENDGRIILNIRGPAQLVGEEALAESRPFYYAEAEVLTPTTLFRIPKDVFSRAIGSNSELCAGFITYLLERRLALAEKVELLCLHDVESRIRYYLGQLAMLVKPLPDGAGYPIPITQLELADLIGATRETTSTTLNQLERRGLVRLSRRMLTVPAPVALSGGDLLSRPPTTGMEEGPPKNSVGNSAGGVA